MFFKSWTRWGLKALKAQSPTKMSLKYLIYGGGGGGGGKEGG